MWNVGNISHLAARLLWFDMVFGCFWEPLSIPDFVLFHTSAAGAFVVCARSQKTRNGARYSADTADNSGSFKTWAMPQQPQTSFHIHWAKLFHQFQQSAQSSLAYSYCTRCRGKLIVLLLDLKSNIWWHKSARQCVDTWHHVAVQGESIHGKDNSLEVLQEGQVSLVPMKWNDLYPWKATWNPEMDPWNLLAKQILSSLSGYLKFHRKLIWAPSSVMVAKNVASCKLLRKPQNWGITMAG